MRHSQHIITKHQQPEGTAAMTVTQTIDPNNIPVLQLSGEEYLEIEEHIAAGYLPSNYLELHEIAKAKNVFGHDHKTDRQGNPIEQGFGSPGNQTANSIAAFRRYHSQDPDFEKNVARMEKELVASNERRKAEAPAQRKTFFRR
jgi:hypothetical protein